MKKVFIIGKCGYPYNIGTEIIEKIVRICGYNPIVAEKKYSTLGQDLLKDIYVDIKASDIVFVDFVPNNFNIAFESGLAYAINDFNNSVNVKNKPGICFLIPQYAFDLNRIPTDIKGIKMSFYDNYRKYAEDVFSFIKEYFSDEERNLTAAKLKVKNYIDKDVKKNNVEDFLDFNSMFEKFELSNSQFNLSGEGIQISNAHFPIYFKNFGYFSDYELTVDCRIDQNAIGFALHILIDKGININSSALPVPLKFFMFNISEYGDLLLHIFDRDIVHSTQHYWAFSNSMKKFNDIKKGEFFKLKVRVNKNIIGISNKKQCFTYNIRELDYNKLNNKNSLNPEVRNNPQLFQEYVRNKVLNKLDHGSFGFRVHPGEIATIKRFELNVF